MGPGSNQIDLETLVAYWNFHACYRFIMSYARHFYLNMPDKFYQWVSESKTTKESVRATRTSHVD